MPKDSYLLTMSADGAVLYRKKKCRCLFVGYGWMDFERVDCRLEGRSARWMDTAPERCRQSSSTQQFELEIESAGKIKPHCLFILW